MLSKFVFPGQKVEYQAVKRTTEGEENQKTYVSTVYDVLSEDRLEITMPMEKTKLILLPVDSEYDICFYTENGLYQSFARIVDRYKSDNVYILLLELTSNLRKYQRREYYRFSCALEMDSRTLQSEEIKAVEEEKRNLLIPGLPLKRSVVVDISGGGLRFVSSQSYEPGSLIYCKYDLLIKGEKKTYNLVGKVLTVREMENREGFYEHRVQYLNMDVDEREEIIRFIFEEERKVRHKEKN
ncbi:MAG: flagellar brake protein [Lachnospiraceae bacterium]|nr:flagellar brake protein [Lachnospiraceae bacterium]